MAMVAMMTYANTRLPRFRLTIISIKPGGMYILGRVIALVLNPLSDELESADLVDSRRGTYTAIPLVFAILIPKEALVLASRANMQISALYWSNG